MEENPDQKSVWKMGFIYYNPDNEKVFVSKRLGIGWTLNFARWPSLLILSLILILVAFAIITTAK